MTQNLNWSGQGKSRYRSENVEPDLLTADRWQVLVGHNGSKHLIRAFRDGKRVYRSRLDLEPEYARTMEAERVAKEIGNVSIIDVKRVIDRKVNTGQYDEIPPEPDANRHRRSGRHDRDEDRTQSHATTIVSLVISAKAEFFHDPSGRAFLTFAVDKHFETHALRSTAARLWLRQLFHQTNEKVPCAQAVADALATLEARAIFDGETHPMHVRLAEQDGSIFLDLANDKWQAVKIDATGWEVISNPPVKFRRPRAMLPLPGPERGGSITELRAFVNVRDERDWTLLLGFLVASLRPAGPFPVLAIYGEQGSAKSSAARIVRALVDPNAAAIRSEPREVRDLMISASNGWVLTAENLSSIPVWLSDAFCRLSTGGGFSTRELYSDDEETVFDAKRPVIINGITEVATRPDLLDRTIAITLPPISEEDRISESELWFRFQAAQPRILGALLDAVSVTLRRLPDTHLDRLPRMADLALWATAAEPGLGLEPGAFMKAYADNQDAVNDFAIETCVIAGPLLGLLEQRGEYRGSASQLLELLENVTEPVWPNKPLAGNLTKGRDWPKKPHVLSGQLRRLATPLRRVGWFCNFDERDPKTRRKIITITRTDGQKSVRSVRSDRSAEGERSHDSPESSQAFEEIKENTDPEHCANDANAPNADSPPFSGRRRRGSV
jgi:hypothetical protein